MGRFAHVCLLFAEKKNQSRHIVGHLGSGPIPESQERLSYFWCWCSPPVCPSEPLETTRGFGYLERVVWPWSPKSKFRYSHHPVVGHILAGEIQGKSVRPTLSILTYSWALYLGYHQRWQHIWKRSTPVLPCLGFPSSKGPSKVMGCFQCFKKTLRIRLLQSYSYSSSVIRLCTCQLKIRFLCLWLELY